MCYAEYADARGDRFVRANSVLDWASATPSAREAQRRLRIVHRLAVALHVEDDRHECPTVTLLAAQSVPANADPSVAGGDPEDHDGGPVPAADRVTHPVDLPLHHRSHRMHRPETLGSDPPAAERPGTGRAPAQKHQDPQGPPGAPAREHLPRPRRLPRGTVTPGGRSEHLFVLASGQPVRSDYLTATFIMLARKASVRGGTGEPGLRLHDLRHGFAVRALEGSIGSSRKDVGRHMLALSTPSDTPASATLTGTSRRPRPHAPSVECDRETTHGGKGDNMTGLAPPLSAFLREYLPRDRGPAGTLSRATPQASGCSRLSPRTGTASAPARSRSGISMSIPFSPSSTISRPSVEMGFTPETSVSQRSRPSSVSSSSGTRDISTSPRRCMRSRRRRAISPVSSLSNGTK